MSLLNQVALNAGPSHRGASGVERRDQPCHCGGATPGRQISAAGSSNPSWQARSQAELTHRSARVQRTNCKLARSRKPENRMSAFARNSNFSLHGPLT